MSTVASVDYVNKRIYLSADTVGVPLDTLDVYRDVRALRRVTEGHRKYRMMIVTGGNIQKTATTYTPPYVQLLYGCFIVPYDTAHSLLIIRDTFSDDGRTGTECFDRSTVNSEVDLDYSVDKVETRIVSVGGSSAPTAAQNAAAVLAAARLTPIHANMKQTNDEDLIGDGTETDKFRSHLVP
jgi:hypothetical protein